MYILTANNMINYTNNQLLKMFYAAIEYAAQLPRSVHVDGWEEYVVPPGSVNPEPPFEILFNSDDERDATIGQITTLLKNRHINADEVLQHARGKNKKDKPKIAPR